MQSSLFTTPKKSRVIDFASRVIDALSPSNSRNVSFSEPHNELMDAALEAICEQPENGTLADLSSIISTTHTHLLDWEKREIKLGSGRVVNSPNRKVESEKVDQATILYTIKEDEVIFQWQEPDKIGLKSYKIKEISNIVTQLQSPREKDTHEKLMKDVSSICGCTLKLSEGNSNTGGLFSVLRTWCQTLSGDEAVKAFLNAKDSIKNMRTFGEALDKIYEILLMHPRTNEINWIIAGGIANYVCANASSEHSSQKNKRLQLMLAYELNELNVKKPALLKSWLNVMRSVAEQHYQKDSFAGLLFTHYLALHYINNNLPVASSVENFHPDLKIFEDFSSRLAEIINILPASIPLWQTWYMLWFHGQELLAQLNPHKQTIEKFEILYANSNKNNGQGGVTLSQKLMSALPTDLSSSYFKQDPKTQERLFKTRKELQQQVAYSHYNPANCIPLFASSYHTASQTLEIFSQKEKNLPGKK